jgi:hypothetical protein
MRLLKIIKWAALAMLMLTTVGLLFRGWFYRHLITYKSVGHRTNYFATNKQLVDIIDANADQENSIDIRQIIKLGLSITSEQLNFTAKKNEIDPNKLISSKTAHCVGYASFFATTCHYLLDKHNLAGTWIAKPQVGHLYFFGINVHQFFKSPFYKDHDFVTIENKTTGETFAVDPTLHDYFSIDFVAYSNPSTVRTLTKLTRNNWSRDTFL